MRPAMVPTSRSATSGLNSTTRRALCSTSRRATGERPTSTVRCMPITVVARNTQRVTIHVRLSSASMPMLWETRWVGSRSTGTSYASIRSTRVAISGTSSTRACATKAASPARRYSPMAATTDAILPATITSTATASSLPTAVSTPTLTRCSTTTRTPGSPTKA